MSWKDVAAVAQIGGAIVGGILGIGSQSVSPNVDGLKAYNNIAELDSGSKKDSDTPDVDSTSSGDDDE